MSVAKFLRIDEALNKARIVWHHCRGRGDNIGVIKIWRIIDGLLDDRLAAAGTTSPPICRSIPGTGTGGACGRVKDRFGTDVYLCSVCDFPHCHNGCGRRAISLQTLFCHTCSAADAGAS